MYPHFFGLPKFHTWSSNFVLILKRKILLGEPCDLKVFLLLKIVPSSMYDWINIDMEGMFFSIVILSAE